MLKHVCCVCQSGLSKLSEAATTVDTLTQQAETQRALLHEKQTEADKALSHIQVTERTRCWDTPRTQLSCCPSSTSHVQLIIHNAVLLPTPSSSMSGS